MTALPFFFVTVKPIRGVSPVFACLLVASSRVLSQECSTIFGCSADVSENLKKYVLFFRFLDRSK
jgi:hypothetical protein